MPTGWVEERGQRGVPGYKGSYPMKKGGEPLERSEKERCSVWIGEIKGNFPKRIKQEVLQDHKEEVSTRKSLRNKSNWESRGRSPSEQPQTHKYQSEKAKSEKCKGNLYKPHIYGKQKEKFKKVLESF